MATNDGGRSVLTIRNKILLNTVIFSRNTKYETISTMRVYYGGKNNVFKKVNVLNVLAILRGKFLVLLQGIKIEDAKEFFLKLEKHSENKNTQFNNTAW